VKLKLLKWITLIPVSVLLAPAPAYSAPAPQANPSGSAHELSLMVGKSIVVNSGQVIERVAVGFGEVAEAMAVAPHEVMLSGKAPGSTTLIIWQQGGGRLAFDVNVLPNLFLPKTRLEQVRQEIARELPDQAITVTSQDDAIFLRGNVKNLTSAGRAVAIASAFGRVVNLLYVDVPEAGRQILLKVRFASVDRSNSKELGINLFSTGATNTIGRTGTGQFSPPGVPQNAQQNGLISPFVFSDLLNIFLFRPDLNLGATIKALEAKNLIEILAEPNVLAQDGKEASFLAGGEFPYPIVQGSGASGVPVVTIQFREFGIHLNFVPVITARGTIQLKVAPEVSSLDYANGATISGYTVPGISTRRVETEVELGNGQSFAIAGLLDKRATDVFEKMPLIGSVPILGKLFQSKSTIKNNTELLVIVTPELVQPVPAGAAEMNLSYPVPLMESSPAKALRTPGSDVTGPVAPPPAGKSIPIEELLKSLAMEEKADRSGPGAGDTQKAVNGTPPMPPATSAPQNPTRK
jgi:pilus assembly protein CpaC